MKKLLLLLLLFTGMANAQIVNIPDANLKTAMINSPFVMDVNGNFLPSVDLNANGQIEVSEALQIGTLIVESANISNLVGMEAFVNLKNFSCAGNQITSVVPLQNLTSMLVLSVANNQITTINLSGLALMNDFTFSGNAVTYLNLSGCSALTYINTLDINNLTYLNINGCSSLNSLNSNAPNLTFISFNGCNALQSLYVSYSQLTSITVSNLNVPQLQINYNSLLTSITIANCPNLTSITCIDNKNTTLDLSGITSLTTLWCANNSLLQTLYIKNGQNESAQLGGNPNLAFICADDGQVAAIQSQLITNSMPNTVCNSYCSFIPGGSYNTITGVIKFDAGNNGCDAADVAQPLIRVNINDATNQGATFTNAAGVYTFYTLAGNFTITPATENPTFFNFSPATATIPFANNNNNTATQNFCITANGIHPDVEVVIEPINFARPGFDATYRIVYKNKGNQTLSGAITFAYNDAVLDYVNATTPPASQSSGTLNWNYSNLLPFENRSFIVTLNVNSSVETPAVNIGDTLNFNASITPTAGDAFPADNAFAYNQVVVGPYDPNNITCIEGPVVPPSQIGNYLHYVVNFENTGNYQAENVVVRDIIDTNKYDVNSLQIMNASHASYTRINGNSVEFIFEDINLAAAAGSPPVGGHGNILFKIKSKSNLVANDFVSKSAKIYFDYNAPITTNNAQTTFQTLSNSVFELDSTIVVHPNPTNGMLTINSSFTIQSIALYDVQGRLLQTNLENTAEVTMDISTRQSGIYFIKISTEKGSKVEKIIKK